MYSSNKVTAEEARGIQSIAKYQNVKRYLNYCYKTIKNQANLGKHEVTVNQRLQLSENQLEWVHTQLRADGFVVSYNKHSDKSQYWYQIRWGANRGL